MEELLLEKLDEDISNELLILKGSCLIELGEFEAGKHLLESLIPKIKDKKRRQKLLVEAAYAEYDLNNYEVAEEMCQKIIKNVYTSDEEKGKCYNLLGLIGTYKKNNIDDALNNFQSAREIYHSSSLALNEAKAEVNIGNIYFMQGDYTNAEKYWKSSLQTNISIGNLDQEAKLLISLGIFYYHELNFEKAVEHYMKANDIFRSLGNKYGQAIVLSNYGEIYLASCEYQNAYESLEKAREMFVQLLNVDEEAAVLFMLGKFYFIIGDN
jgi:tetratricopeptide (TPR) repeat protein